jgi:hypothetical protein
MPKNKIEIINQEIENKIKNSLIKKEEITKKLTELKEQILKLEQRFSASELQSEIIKEFREKVKNYMEIVQQEFTTSFEEIKNLSQELIENYNETTNRVAIIVQFLYNTLNDLKKMEINSEQKKFLLAKEKELEGIIKGEIK